MVLVFGLYPALSLVPTRPTTRSFIHSADVGPLWILFSDNSSNWGPGPPTAVVTNSTRSELLAFIVSNPGVYLRYVSEEMGLAMGDVQYHLWILIKEGVIVDRRDGRYRRFFESGRYGEVEQKVISVLRQDTAGRILVRLAEFGPISHMRLAATLGVTSQAVTWQMRRLTSLGIVEVVSGIEGQSYRLADCAREPVERRLVPVETCRGQGVTGVEAPATEPPSRPDGWASPARVCR